MPRTPESRYSALAENTTAGQAIELAIQRQARVIEEINNFLVELFQRADTLNTGPSSQDDHAAFMINGLIEAYTNATFDPNLQWTPVTFMIHLQQFLPSIGVLLSDSEYENIFKTLEQKNMALTVEQLGRAGAEELVGLIRRTAMQLLAKYPAYNTAAFVDATAKQGLDAALQVLKDETN